MSPPRIADRTLFALEGAFFNWEAMLGSHPGVLTREQFLRLSRSGRVRETALRWHVAAHRGNFVAGVERGIGLPTGPFTVWRRPSVFPETGGPIEFAIVDWGALGYRVGAFARELVAVQLTVEATGPAVVFGLADPSDPLSIVTHSLVPDGTSFVLLHGPGMGGFLAPANVEVSGVKGATLGDYDTAGGWEAIEIVGLPVDEADWDDVADQADPQGLVASLEAPREAALGRLDRSAPPTGWAAEVEPGVAAPPWRRPDSGELLDEVDAGVLAPLRAALLLRQDLQAAARYEVELPPPATLAGEPMPADPSPAEISPIAVLQASVSSDPFLSLALGYGTTAPEPPPTDDVQPFHAGSLWDYRVTAPYASGLDGRSEAVELVAYWARPAPVVFPPVPAGLAVEHLAHESPRAVDEPWSAAATARWERPPRTTLFRVASYAAARRDAGDTSTRALMERRASGGFSAIAPAVSPDDAEANFVHVTDPHFAIPNDPGERSLRYSVATQNPFGLWSAWGGADHTIAQPAPVAPRIVSATLSLPAPPAGKLCTGGLVVDVTWDWTDRRPATIELTGILYACAERGDGPPAGAPPSTLDRTPGGGQPKTVLTFAGDVVTGADDVRYLNLAGDAEVEPGAAQSNTVRRYRLTLGAFSVDFATTPHVGLALWARGTERLAPGHAASTTGPVVVFASDPVAPPLAVTAAEPPTVPLGSLPDAQGSSHGRLAWPAVAGAFGYYVYTADELTLLAHHGVAEPAPAATLSERYRALLDLFEADPDRTPFTRVNARPLTGTSLDVALPRGSRAIHCYVVITAGPGSTEGPWPAGDDARAALSALAAPRIAVPPPPELLATPGVAAGSVALEVTTRAGAPVERVDVHRVRVADAARRVETMGPPIASVPAAGAGGWTAETLADGRLAVRGADAPGASWRRTWYRAVAWSLPDDERGLVRGASAPSNPFALVLAPADAPDLSPLEATWPGGALADVRLDFTSAASAEPTPLGPHRISVHVDDLGDPENPVALVSTELDLDQVPEAAPVTGSGLWREPASDPAAYRVLVPRHASAPALSCRVRLVDPLGRSAEQARSVRAGPVLPAPRITDARATTIARGLLLTFASAAPIVAPPGGPYTLRAAAPRRVGRPLAVELALGDIPAVRSLPESREPLLVVRQVGRGPSSYAVLAQVPVTRIDVTLRSPDGRSATATSGEVPAK